MRSARSPGSPRARATAGTSSLLGALVLLAWNPYTLLDAGFQLSFAAVAAIFVLVPRCRAMLEGYPLPRQLGAVVAVSTACGLATAPMLWLQFHAVPLLTVPANALAAPAVAPLLGLAFASGRSSALVCPAAATALAWAERLVRRLSRALRARRRRACRSRRSAHGPLAAVLLRRRVLAAAYAWRRWQSSKPST